MPDLPDHSDLPDVPAAGSVATASDDDVLEAMKDVVDPDEDVLEDGIAFAGVAKFPARIKCALLSWMAFKDAALQAQDPVVEPVETNQGARDV